jgi:PAS domain S-box-containing protein
VKKNKKITADKEHLGSMQRDRDFSEHIINNSRSMISIINRKYIYEKVNATFCNAHQLICDSIVGKSLGDVWGEEIFHNHIKGNIDSCFAGNTVKYEAVFETPGSGERYFEVVFRPIHDDDGEITHLLAETFDINDLWTTRQAVIEKEEELRKFETNLPIGFIRCDIKGKIIHVNKAFLRIMGLNEEIDIADINIRDFYVDDQLFEIQFAQLKDCKSKTFGRVLLKNPKGREIPCRLNGFLAVNDSGLPSFVDFAIEDNSRELMLESRLLQAQKLETIGALAGGIAHDFNNVLTTISGYSEMLLEDLRNDSDKAEKVCKIQAAVRKAQSIINQMLTYSRQIEQEKIRVSITKVLQETIGFVQSAAPGNVQIKSHVQKNNALVYADPTQLFRVFLNLMTNGIQSMEEKGGTLTVNLEVIDGNLVKHDLHKDIVADEYVLITFMDTGTGIDPSSMNRIFEPFFTTREVGKGTGLGLSVVHAIISELEGEIVVSSTMDKGSVFNVYLPQSKEIGEISGRDEPRKKILFIAGNRYESSILSLALENTGYELLYLSESQDLVKFMSEIKNHPDLVIYMSDSEQVGTDDLIAVFRELRISTPCILITDPAQDLLEENLLNSGIINQQLSKPVSLREIRDAIQASLK